MAAGNRAASREQVDRGETPVAAFSRVRCEFNAIRDVDRIQPGACRLSIAPMLRANLVRFVILNAWRQLVHVWRPKRCAAVTIERIAIGLRVRPRSETNSPPRPRRPAARRPARPHRLAPNEQRRDKFAQGQSTEPYRGRVSSAEIKLITWKSEKFICWNVNSAETHPRVIVCSSSPCQTNQIQSESLQPESQAYVAAARVPASGAASSMSS